MHSYSLLSYCCRIKHKKASSVSGFLWFFFCVTCSVKYVFSSEQRSIALTLQAGCLRALCWWCFPHPASLDSSCERLGPPPTTRCSRPPDLNRKMVTITVKHAENKAETLISGSSSSACLCTVWLSAAYLSQVYPAGWWWYERAWGIQSHSLGRSAHPSVWGC